MNNSLGNLVVVQKSSEPFDVPSHRLFALPVRHEFGHCWCDPVAIEIAKIDRKCTGRKDVEEEKDVHQRISGCWSVEF